LKQTTSSASAVSAGIVPPANDGMRGFVDLIAVRAAAREQWGAESATAATAVAITAAPPYLAL